MARKWLDSRHGSGKGSASKWIRGAGAPLLVIGGVVLVPNALSAARATTVAAATSSCALGSGGTVKHVIYIQFDNTHFTRTNPNVPSDIEQIPSLYNFMTEHGTVITNDHTPLIAHTADDLVTSLTGVYPNDTGIPEANSYRYYQPTGTTGTAGSFSYWRDPVDSYTTTTTGLGTDLLPNMIDSAGKMAPAPWVPYTRAGCSVGDVAVANMDLENTVPDVPLVFGQTSPEATLARTTYTAAVTEFEGLSVHCAKGAAFCADNPRPVTDLLPTEPGGYHGYKAVFGSKYLDTELGATEPITNFTGQVITGSTGMPGFPGYTGMQPKNALAYTLKMQQSGIPVTYTYLTDAHTKATGGGGMGPGQAQYETQLASYTKAFTTFFADLTEAGITKTNTLFVFGEDENDHYVGSAPTTPNCTGVHVPCTYSQLGEVDLNLRGLLNTEAGITTPFAVHSDSAPFVYLDGQPARTTPTVRTFERAVAHLQAYDPYKAADVQLANYLADPVELNVLHMITADPNRTPTFALFANPDFYLYRGGSSCTGTPKNCDSYDTEVWNHGDVSPDINRSWMAFVGPGVRNLGTDPGLWASETDTRPTLMALLGLTDDYTHEGRVLTPIMTPGAMSPALASSTYEELAEAYTEIEQPVGPFGLDTLTASTNGIASGSAKDDSTYQRTESQIEALGAHRDRVGASMIALLEAAAFQGKPVPAGQANGLIAQAQALLKQAQHLAG